MTTASSDGVRIAVCIPTVGRPVVLRRVLESLARQTRPADVVLVVDASSSDDTNAVCAEMETAFATGALSYEHTARGLTLQRRIGIAKLRSDPAIRYIGFLDDDIVLEPEFLQRIVDFMESDAGRGYGGMCGYDLVDWGKPFGRFERVCKRLGIFDGELRPGRWLYGGYILELDRLQPSADVVPVEFLPGGLTVWRVEVFDRFLPPVRLPGYALNEDKHLSLRVRSEYALGAHCGARVHHLRAEAGRPGRVRFGYDGIRNLALLIRDCDPAPSVARYLAFLAFHLLLIPSFFAEAVARRRWTDLRFVLGWAIGWVSCVLAPPRRTQDALTSASTAANGNAVPAR